MKSNEEWLESLSDTEMNEIIDDWELNSIEEDLIDSDSLQKSFDDEYENYLLSFEFEED